MKSRGILFSAPMVRALLAGTKTVTRRIVKPQPEYDADSPWPGWKWPSHQARGMPSACPYGTKGDRMWVRETWGLLDTQPSDGADGATVFYRATDESRRDLRFQLWRPSIFMPRWASRIELEVVSVRVERLHELTEEDARMEGVSWGGGDKIAQSAREAFRCLWDAINPGTWAASPWVWRIAFKCLQGQP